jgi:transposase InsO family protein
MEKMSHGIVSCRILEHHSDRVPQYASRDYTELLVANRIRISMSRKTNPRDNAAGKSFMKTLKSAKQYQPDRRVTRYSLTLEPTLYARPEESGKATSAPERHQN